MTATIVALRKLDQSNWFGKLAMQIVHRLRHSPGPTLDVGTSALANIVSILRLYLPGEISAHRRKTIADKIRRWLQPELIDYRKPDALRSAIVAVND